MLIPFLVLMAVVIVAIVVALWAVEPRRDDQQAEAYLAKHQGLTKVAPSKREKK